MIAFILRRLLLMIPTTFGVALVVFALFHAAPGDPATVMMGGGGTGELDQGSDTEGRVDRFRRKHGLDRSLVVQFFDYMGPFNLSRDGVTWLSSPIPSARCSKSRARTANPCAWACLSRSTTCPARPRPSRTSSMRRAAP
ncbi:MAG: hypothetical protein R3E96_08685 [Planctomycetota bacterium]